MEAWQRAHGEEFRPLVSRPEFVAFLSTPALYELIDAGGELSDVESRAALAG